MGIINDIPAGCIGLYFRDNEKKALYRFAIVDNLPALLDVAQLVMDTRDNALADVIALDPARPGMFADVARIAAHYGMRKRTFSEKLENVKTYTIPEGGTV